jgi:Skp family chaperone for outer membrane proteins
MLLRLKLATFPFLSTRGRKPFCYIGLAAFCVICAQAKDAVVSGIELYDGPNGAAYVQVTDLLINGKTELRNCASAAKIDKSAYGRLPRITLNSATSLQRGLDGVLTLTKDSATVCVVPSNLKFDKDVAQTPSELADRAVLQGKVLPSAPAGPDTPPALKPGVEIRFIPVPDVEFAEYLRADRAHSIALWQEYLIRYATSAHADQAKHSLLSLYLKEGEDSLAAYRKSASSAAPSYADLKKAKVRADQSLELIPANAPATKLRDDVRAELGLLTDKARTELQSYQQALAGHTAGLSHLVTARKLVDQIVDIDSLFDSALKVQTNVNSETRVLESSLRSAESLVTAQRIDDALAAIDAYRAFADEEPRIAAVLNAAYKLHFDRGTASQSAEKWQEAVQEYQKAYAIKKTEEAAASLQKAQTGLQTFQNRTAADAALKQSQDFEQQHQDIEAYEVLATLPDAPRALVSDRMQSLEPAYIKAASLEAKKLQEAHTPIHGRADEVGVQRAYDLLQRATSLSDDTNVKLRLDLLSEAISDYYLQQAKRYFEKPLGSGAGLGWLYLNQSQLYKPNRDDVRDERTKNASIYQMRSKLSIRVVFRDQTSRRDSAGFAEQLSDAIATGLETSGLMVRVIRPNDPTSVDPNFQLVGDVLQHRPIMNPSVEPMESKYRSGEREVPNEDWNKANRDYESASLDLQNAQRIFQGAQSRSKKKEIADANLAVSNAQKKVEDIHTKLDSIPKTTPMDIVKPYTYTKKTINLAAVVDLAFRIVDASNNPIEATTPITRNAEKTFVILENVKPEDTEGIKAQGAPPDEIQFLTDVEIEARDTLIKAVREKVSGLPPKILEQARKRAADGDLDGAAESYILYLNSTAETQTPERGEARRFLQTQFNMRQVATF